MRTFFVLMLIALTSSKIFLNNQVNLKESLNLQSGNDDAYTYLSEIIKYINETTSGLMNFIETNINEQLYENLKNYSSIITLLQKNTYYQIRVKMKNYYIQFLKKIKEFDFKPVFDLILNEIQEFLDFSNKTQFNEFTEKLLVNVRNDLQQFKEEMTKTKRIQKHFERIRLELKDFNEEKIALSLIESLDNLRKQYSKITENELKNDIFNEIIKLIKQKAKIRESIVEFFDTIKTGIEIGKLNITKVCSNIDFNDINDNVFLYIKELDVNQFIEVLKYLLTRIKNIFSSQEKNSIKNLLNQLLNEINIEFIPSQIRHKIYEIFEKVLDGKYIQDKYDFKLIMDIHQWCISFIQNIKTKDELLDSLRNLMEKLRPLDLHTPLDTLAYYIKRNISIGFKFINIMIEIGSTIFYNLAKI